MTYPWLKRVAFRAVLCNVNSVNRLVVDHDDQALEHSCRGDRACECLLCQEHGYVTARLGTSELTIVVRGSMVFARFNWADPPMRSHVMLMLLPDGTLVPILRGKHRVKLVVELQDTFASLGFNLREREKPGLKSQLKGPDAVLYVERLILEGRKNSAFDELSSETNLSRDAVERRYYREKKRLRSQMYQYLFGTPPYANDVAVSSREFVPKVVRLSRAWDLSLEETFELAGILSHKSSARWREMYELGLENVLASIAQNRLNGSTNARMRFLRTKTPNTQKSDLSYPDEAG